MRRVNDTSVDVEVSDDVLGSQQFGIRDRDMHLILDMLRSKLYSDPVLAVCREYMCNARDAHREVGKEDIPIEVVLPTVLSPQLEIRDWGPGINPKRMADIFMFYGASTKTRTNKQTGVFGIGGKSALAVSSQFNVVVVYRGEKRQYRFYIDESKLGQGDLLSCEPTNEQTGTRIIVPVSATDLNRYTRAVIKVSQFWDVRPIVKNMPAAYEYEVFSDPRLSGEGWTIGSSPTKRMLDMDDNAYAILDGIHYPFRCTDLGIPHYAYSDDDKFHAKVRSLLGKKIFIWFKTGQLNVVPSREQLHFDEKTKATILAQVKRICSELHANALKKLADSENLLSAEIYWDELSRYMPAAVGDKPVKWNGIELTGLRRPAPGITVRGYMYEYAYRSGEHKFRSNQLKEIVLGKSVKLVWNDTGKKKIPAARIKKFLDENSDYDSVTVMDFMGDSYLQKTWLETHHFNELGIEPITSLPEVPRAKRGSKAYKGTRPDINCWKHDYSGWRDTVADKNGSGVYLVSINKNQGDYDYGKLKFRHRMSDLISASEEKDIYLIPRRMISTLGSGWRKLDDVIIEKLTKKFAQISIADVKQAVANYERRGLDPLGYDVRNALATAVKENEIDSKADADFIQEYLDLDNSIKEEYENCRELHSILTKFGYLIDADQTPAEPSKELAEAVKKLITKYPLLKHVSSVPRSDIVAYINAVDFKNNNNKPNNKTATSRNNHEDMDPVNFCVAV